MKSIAYISPDNFFDVDIPILVELRRHYLITWYAIFPQSKSKFTKSTIQNYCSTNDINLRILKRQGRYRNINQIWFNIKLLKKIKRQNADIIYIEDMEDIYFSLLSPLFLSRKKTIIAVHDFIPHKNTKNLFINISKKILYNFFIHFHLYSISQQNSFIKKHPGKNTFYAPLALKDFGQQKANLKDTKTITNFLFFGNIKYYKGLDLLIKAAELIYEEGFPNFKIRIAGQGNLWDELKMLVNTKTLFKSSIRVIEPNEIPDLFANAHFIVLPYRDVTQSGPLMIALNYNLPAIVSNHEGFTNHIKHKKNGFVFESENIESLKNVLKSSIQLSKIDYDKIKRNLFSLSDKEYAIENIIKKYLIYFQKIDNA